MAHGKSLTKIVTTSFFVRNLQNPQRKKKGEKREHEWNLWRRYLEGRIL